MQEKEEYEAIIDHTKNKYSNKTEKDLIRMHSQEKNEIWRDNIKLEMDRRLIKEIKRFNQSSSKQSKWMIILTIIIAFLTVFMLVGIIIQTMLILG